MAIVTTNYYRIRTELKTISNATLATVESQYATYEGTKAADATKTWSVRIVSMLWDGTNFVLVAEASYIERNEDFTGQVP